MCELINLDIKLNNTYLMKSDKDVEYIVEFTEKSTEKSSLPIGQNKIFVENLTSCGFTYNINYFCNIVEANKKEDVAPTRSYAMIMNKNSFVYCCIYLYPSNSHYPTELLHIVSIEDLTAKQESALFNMKNGAGDD